MLENLKFNHIGIVTDDLLKTAKLYEDAGFSLSEPVHDGVQKVQIIFALKENHPAIELIAPATADSPVNKVLEKNGVSPYHVCYETDDMVRDIRLLKQRKFIPVTSPVAATAMDDRKICFLYHKNFGLIELVQSGG